MTADFYFDISNTVKGYFHYCTAFCRYLDVQVPPGSIWPFWEFDSSAKGRNPSVDMMRWRILPQNLKMANLSLEQSLSRSKMLCKCGHPEWCSQFPHVCNHGPVIPLGCDISCYCLWACMLIGRASHVCSIWFDRVRGKSSQILHTRQARPIREQWASQPNGTTGRE